MILDTSQSILENIRVAVGLSKDSVDFDAELLMHINTALLKLNQNGIGNILMVIDNATTWGDFKDITQIEGNKYFNMIPLFVMLSTKQIFDPPPPSTVEYYSRNIDEIIWRLRLAYEEPLIVPAILD